MRRIFIDDRLEGDISVKGYAVIKNAASGDICNELSDFFSRFENIDQRKFTISNWSTDAAYRHQAYLFIADKLSALSEKYLVNYRAGMGVFTAKRPGADSDMLLHQDWSLVDETAYRSVSIWLALCDTDRDNGNLQVAERSHLYAGFPRGMNVPVPFDGIREEMLRYMTDVPLHAGDAIVFDHRLIHGSPANRSDHMRLAAVMALIPSEAELIHYYYDPDHSGQLEVLKMDEEQFHLLDFFNSPHRPKHLYRSGTIPFSFQKVELAILDSNAVIKKAI